MLRQILTEEVRKLKDNYKVCGFVDKTGLIYPLGADTKVLSTVFELVCRPAIFETARKLGKKVVEPSVQNHYPDYTLQQSENDNQKIAIDIKTTYRNKDTDKFNYTLGGYTSFIRKGNEKKNIVYSFDEYAEHWVIGFVYNRIAEKKSAAEHSYQYGEIGNIPLPFDNVEVFVQEKWKISSDKAGSGNTTNIGSINGHLKDFEAGLSPFTSEEEFFEYWRSYGKTASDRTDYKNISEFRSFKQR
jgi:hypothetical protein